ncbi:MAG: tRNA pseudouridine(55) synthase TruB [Flavipsychrobacter sp.]|nr:tRNA pseudouridine(55) synthase TruB [Flavipsychrobacter sp.]
MTDTHDTTRENPFAAGAVLLIDKPLDWTSFDVVRKLRNQVRTKKVGHAGTLDPLATGLLIVCTGKFTKKINEYMAQEKEYTGTFQLGASTPTYDLESAPRPTPGYHIKEDGVYREDGHKIDYKEVDAAMEAFRGPIMQVPPIHSAIKINGQRVYELARKGKEVKLEPRPVTIQEFNCLKLEAGMVHFKVICTTGTYIRSLANDLGETIGCGAYLTSLRRTRIGTFKVEDALTMEMAAGYIQQQLEGGINS